jgi:hypothetical protein
MVQSGATTMSSIRKLQNLTLVLFLALSSIQSLAEESEPWSTEKANQWSEKSGWLVGCNFTPSTAINQLEMWQADTFDLETIDRELNWAHELGFNSVRVFLHNLCWEQDSEGFCERIDQFLKTAESHQIGVMFVLFDGVWDPQPALGTQREPRAHIHNSGWVQSPGASILANPKSYDDLKPYVQGIISRYRDDPRVQVWDIFNEPDNGNVSSYRTKEIPNKDELAFKLLRKTYTWARETTPTQPITSGLWHGDWSDHKSMKAMDRFMVSNSDVISFHSYNDLAQVKKKVEALQKYNRPLLCTEYMARQNNSTFQSVLPYFKEQIVGAYSWGFVSGKTQTIYPWDSWSHNYTAEPRLWFHDILRSDGTPFDRSEAALLRQITSGEN